MSKRDNFSEGTKRAMAERVAWRCSFPKCGKITIGPRMGEGEEKNSLNLGEAAHIVAAAEDGPRFDKDTTSEFRKSINNGIWMCRAHARFIDTDHKEHSVETLKLWKLQAEDQAYKDLRLQENYEYEDRSTLIAIGFNLMLYGIWQSVKNNEWEFLVVNYLKGTSNDLRNYSDNFEAVDENQRFIAVESQGDARVLNASIQIFYLEDGSESFRVKIDEKVLATQPSNFGSSLKLGGDGDLVVSKGRLQTISGVDAAIQKIAIAAGTIYGECFFDSTIGSFITAHFHKYNDNIRLLEKTIKLELIRLSLISRLSIDGEIIKPPLDFVKEVVSVSIPSIVLDASRLCMELTLILGDETEWKGDIKIFVLEYSKYAACLAAGSLIRFSPSKSP